MDANDKRLDYKEDNDGRREFARMVSELQGYGVSFTVTRDSGYIYLYVK